MNLFLLFLKALSHTFYKVESRWLDPTPQPPWKRLRVLVFLHHTSLYEWLFVAVAPNHLLKRVANHGLILIPTGGSTQKNNRYEVASRETDIVGISPHLLVHYELP